MKVLSLFSGIGAFEKALTNLNIEHEIVGYSEIDKYAIESYSAIHDVSTDLNLGDVAKIKEEDLPNADLITYGFPCQDISVAGLGKGINEGTRSGLLYEAERVINHVKPKYAIAENVKNLVGKSFKKDFEELLNRLSSYDYNNYWEVLNAKDYGIPQNRERVFIVSIRKDVDTKRFLFPSKFDSGLRLKDMLEDEVDDSYYIDTDRTINLISNLEGNNNELQKAGYWEYPNSSKQHQSNTFYYGEGISPTLDTMAGGNSQPKILENKLQLHSNLKGGKWDKIHENARRIYKENCISPTTHTMQGGNSEPKVAVKQGTAKGYDIATVGDSINLAFPDSETRRGRVGKQVSQTLDTSCEVGTLEQDYRIRKLTPLECWRLMGFADEDYNKARQALEDRFYNGKDRSNSQMYKMAGNSIVVNVLEAIFKNLILEEEVRATKHIIFEEQISLL